MRCVSMATTSRSLPALGDRRGSRQSGEHGLRTGKAWVRLERHLDLRHRGASYGPRIIPLSLRGAPLFFWVSESQRRNYREVVSVTNRDTAYCSPCRRLRGITTKDPRVADSRAMGIPAGYALTTCELECGHSTSIVTAYEPPLLGRENYFEQVAQ